MHADSLPGPADLQAAFDAARTACLTGHQDGCTYGGPTVGTGYWLVAEGCQQRHGECAWCGGAAVTGFAGDQPGDDDRIWGIGACRRCFDAYLAAHPDWWRTRNGEPADTRERDPLIARAMAELEDAYLTFMRGEIERLLGSSQFATRSLTADCGAAPDEAWRGSHPTHVVLDEVPLAAPRSSSLAALDAAILRQEFLRAPAPSASAEYVFSLFGVDVGESDSRPVWPFTLGAVLTCTEGAPRRPAPVPGVVALESIRDAVGHLAAAAGRLPAPRLRRLADCVDAIAQGLPGFLAADWYGAGPRHAHWDLRDEAADSWKSWCYAGRTGWGWTRGRQYEGSR